MVTSAQNNKRAAPSDHVATKAERPAKVMKFDFLNTVKIAVDECEIEFAVPKNLMIQRSRVFANRNSEGSIDKPFNLSSVWKENLPRYLQLLYTGQVGLFSDEEKATAEQKWAAIVLLEILTRDVCEDVVSGEVPPDLYQFEKGVALLQNAVSELSMRKRSGEERPKQNTKEGMKRYHESVE